MNLLNALLMIFAMWRPTFCKTAAFIRAKELAFASLCAAGRKTITSMAIFLGRSNRLPVADYKFYSDSKWNVEDLFNPILELASQHVEGQYLCFAADDTKVHKTGKKIPYAGWQADPLGPKFQTNLIWALRYLQTSILLPLYKSSENTPARSIPVRFTAAPCVKKPGKKATEEEWKMYKALSKKHNYTVGKWNQKNALTAYSTSTLALCARREKALSKSSIFTGDKYRSPHRGANPSVP